MFVIVATYAGAQLEQRTADFTPQSTPIYELLKHRPKYDTHLSELEGDLVLVQVKSFKDETKATEFLKLHASLGFIGIKIKGGDDELSYLILLGAYDDMDSARWAIEDFQELIPTFRTDQIKRISLNSIREQILR